MPAFSNQKLLSRSGIEQLYSPQAEGLGVYGLVFDAYGFGYYTEAGTAVSHGGQGTGWMSHFHAVPETGDAIVILTNSQRSWPFIAAVLNGWAQWRGFPAPGMTRILLGECVLWALVGLLAAAVLIALVGLGLRIANRDVRFFSLRGIRRKGQLGLSIVLLGVLLWCAGQRYLFLTTVFPTVSLWLFICAAVLAVSLLPTALLKDPKIS
jgi:hypothetical protein